MINNEKKARIVRRANRKGLDIDESQVNLLQMENNPVYESVASSTSMDDSSSSDENEIHDNVSELGKRDSGFGFRLKRMGYGAPTTHQQSG